MEIIDYIKSNSLNIQRYIYISMATLNEIENFLNIETADKRLRPGKKYADKQKYADKTDIITTTSYTILLN